VINRPWWKSYDEGVRSQLTYPEVCVHNLLQKIAFSKGSSTAIEIDQDRITYGELDRVSTNFARNLISLGVKKGMWWASAWRITYPCHRLFWYS